ncbi:MAG TPA: glycosyltransferase family 39 protein [Acidimicrobiales bacterium]|nr:glycosyltransferase family 39 protein [Acidimicrobiales bacterium]
MAATARAAAMTDLAPADPDTPLPAPRVRTVAVATPAALSPADGLPGAPPARRPTATETTLAPRLRPLLRPAKYYLGSRLVVWAAALVAGLMFPTLNPVRSLGSIWDGRWYLSIAQYGYPHRMYQEGLGSRWGFFPAFPAAIRIVAEVTRLSLPDAAVLAAFVFGLTATVAIWLAVREVFGERLADRATLLFVFFPLSCMLSFAYTEGLFLTAAAGALYALQRRWWITAALCACVAGLTRNAGAVVILCVLVVALPASWRERRLRPAAAAALAPLGLASFMAYSWAMVGTPLAFLTSERFWQGQHFVWFMTPVNALLALVTDSAHGLHLVQAAWCTAAVVSVYFGVVCLLALSRARRVPAAWWLYTLGTVAIAFSAYYTQSIPRYTLVAFPLFVAVGWKLRAASRAALTVAFGCLQGVVTVVFLIGVVHPMSPPFVP